MSPPPTRSKPERIPFDLNDGERWWRDHYDMLKDHGYQLRPRFHPDWKPSWTARRLPGVREDSYVNYHPKVIDATRLSDKTRVAIKKLRKGNVFGEEEDTMEFMVMPLLKAFDDPSFDSVDEVIDFISQTLQGLAFMHAKGVAHRDCSDAPYDPFLADVFILGNLYKRSLVGLYENIDFLAPLADAMTQEVPIDRPDVETCLDMFNDITKQQTPRFLRQLLVYRDADKFERLLCSLGTMKREAAAAIKSVIRIDRGDYQVLFL
ncbi:hypothetical protein ACEPAF_122 [Sanghuangporus sanghuang]